MLHYLKYFVAFIYITSFSQNKPITLEEIWSGKFRQDYLNEFSPMQGDNYSLLNYNRKTRSTTIDQYSYKTLEKTTTLVDSKNIPEINYFDAYTFNNDENLILLATNTTSIYRHSSQAIFYCYNRTAKKITLIDAEPIQEPTFSNDGSKVAYVKANNIFVKDLKSNKTVQLTKDGKKNYTINGITDWVYEEEFAFVKAFEWSNDDTKIAYLKFDEGDVPFFSMDYFGKELYPSSFSFKYPKAGEKNAEVSMHIIDIVSKKDTKTALGKYEYIPLLKSKQKGNDFVVATLNRHQNDLNIYTVNSLDNSKTLLLHETDAAYIDVEKIFDITFLKNNNFIWQSEKDGFNHLYYYSAQGKLIKQITQGNWEVSKFYGINGKENKLFYQSTEDGSIHKTIYETNLYGKRKKRISKNTGTNDADFSTTKNYAIINHSDASTPLSYHLFDGKKIIKEVKNNQALADLLSQYNIGTKEFSELKTQGGTFNLWMIKPANFDPNKKYPLLMAQYSGPGSQSVSNSWNGYNDYWYHMLAQKGYIIACVDARGTGYKGAAFKKVTYKQLGKYETIDQINAAKELGALPYIDARRIAIWGWSYGGFMASNCLLKGADVFSTAIAVAPVTSWRYYDSVYTERYMQTPQENPEGYDDNSPLFFAKKLKGNYLLVHGTGDDNVHVQNAYQMTNALIEANKEFEQAIYPDRAHGIYRGKNTRLHLFTKMTKFLDKHLLNN